MSRTWGAAFIGLLAATQALGAQPQLGGPMKHLLVTLSGTTVFVAHESNPEEPLTLYDYGESYAPPADVLTGRHYSGRYGWLAEGFWSVPAGRGMFVECLEATEGLAVHEELTFNPLFGTQGSSPVWRWSTTMVHNWYSASTCGKYAATYRVYVGFTASSVYGQADPAYTPGVIVLRWQALPFEVLGDADDDADADLADFSIFQTCHDRADGADTPRACGCLDFDGDDDVDLLDFAVFAEALADR